MSSTGADLEAAAAAGPPPKADLGGASTNGADSSNVGALASEEAHTGNATGGLAPMSIDESYAAEDAALRLDQKQRRRERLLIMTACMAMALGIVIWICMPWAAKDRAQRWPPEFEGAIFVAEKSSDLDSIAAAVGAAELYRGFAACAAPTETCLGESNSQTRRTFEYFGLDESSVTVESLPTSFEKHPKPGVVVVDFNSPKAYPADSLPEAPKLVSEEGKWLPLLVGVIDRHALDMPGVMQTESPKAVRETKNNIVIFSSPFTATSTIIARHCQQAQCQLSSAAANLLITAIHSRAKLAKITADDHEAIRFLTPLADGDKLLRQSYWSQVVGEAACGWKPEASSGTIAAGETCKYSDFNAVCGVMNTGSVYYGDDKVVFGGEAKAGTCTEAWSPSTENHAYTRRFTCSCKLEQVEEVVTSM